MPDHVLPEGKQWIEDLVEFGHALGYRTETEFDVAPKGEPEAPVDVAWFRSEHDEYPLFIFEVESVPGGQMTQNAAKVFSQESDLFEKPLFHFHLVLSGKGESGRIASSERLFGKFNYRIYSMAKEDEALACICDVVSQHRRVSERLDVGKLAAYLAPGRRPEIDLDAVWEHAERCEFNAAWARDYSSLALSEGSFRPRLARVFRRHLEGERLIDASTYGSAYSEFCAEPLQLAYLALECPEIANECFAALRRWQAATDPPRLAPRYGQSADFDAFVFDVLPGIWGVIAASIGDVPGARRWIADQLEGVSGAGSGRGPLEMGALAAIWTLHVSAGQPDCDEPYRRARDYLDADGGIARALCLSPPAKGGPVDDLDNWGERLRENAESVPGCNEMAASTAPQSVETSVLVLELLTYGDPPDRGAEISAALHGPPAKT